MKRLNSGPPQTGLLVSGDVALVDSGDEAVSRLVRTASTLFATPDFKPTALVGGLAVTIRLATVHRATNDVDTVSEGDGPRNLALQYLSDAGAAASNRIEINGVNVDILATWPLPPSMDELPDSDLDRLFVLGHRWALDSATPVAVDVLSADGFTVAESGPLIVATTPALLACKLHAIADRRGPATPKRESDALDVVRLIRDLIRSDQQIDSLVAAPFDLAELVTTQVERWFIDEALRTARLAGAATAGTERFDPGDLSTLGRLLINRLASP